MNELEGLDAPLPLPDALRARLEAQLLAPRPLEEGQRSALEARLVRRPRRWLVPAAAAAAAVAVLGGVLLLDGPAAPATEVALRPTPTASATPTATTPASGGAFGGGSTGGTAYTGREYQTTDSVTAGKTLTDATSPPLAPAAAPLPRPYVDEVRPAVASAGDVVALRGVGLGDPVEVRFGSAVAEVVAAKDDVLRVRVPAGTGTVDVVVETRRGTTDPVRFTYSS